MQRPRAVPILIAAIALLSVPLAAYSQCGGGTVLPGADVCLQPFSATSSVTADGVSDVVVVFTVNQSGTTLFSSKGTSFSWSTTNPSLFPGYFLVCAHRPSNHTTSANVTLCISN
jgi:hypothetical protein